MRHVILSVPLVANAQVVILGLLCFIVFSLERRDLSDRLGAPHILSGTVRLPSHTLLLLLLLLLLVPPLLLLVPLLLLNCCLQRPKFEQPRSLSHAEPAVPCCAPLRRHCGHAVPVHGSGAVCHPRGPARQLVHPAHPGDQPLEFGQWRGPGMHVGSQSSAALAAAAAGAR